MGMMFRLTDAGRLIHDHPDRYPQHSGEREMALLKAMRGGASFDDIVRHVPGEMFEVLQAMATAMASGLLERYGAEREPDSGMDNVGLGHGRW